MTSIVRLVTGHLKVRSLCYSAVLHAQHWFRAQVGLAGDPQAADTTDERLEVINLHYFIVVECCCFRADLESLLPDMGALVAIDQTVAVESAVLGVIVTVTTNTSLSDCDSWCHRLAHRTILLTSLPDISLRGVATMRKWSTFRRIQIWHHTGRRSYRSPAQEQRCDG